VSDGEIELAKSKSKVMAKAKKVVTKGPVKPAPKKVVKKEESDSEVEDVESSESEVSSVSSVSSEDEVPLKKNTKNMPKPTVKKSKK